MTSLLSETKLYNQDAISEDDKLNLKESLCGDFSCSLLYQNLIPGRLYCTDNYFCFFSDCLNPKISVRN